MADPSMAAAPEVEREVRFAVVIYGGVSLAVYINGVVQEMLRMVQATADNAPEGLLTSAYRQLACIVGEPPPAQEGEADFAGPAATATLHGVSDDGTYKIPEGATPRTRFIVDILSGTSAGGINAIYLAKALANGESLKQLADMWLNVADFGRLLNDKYSREFPVEPQNPPRSLLNSRWMYLKLLEALDDMGDETTGTGPLAEDIDLFTTATDLDGVALPIALADRQVLEFRHRNVFHFTKRGEQNDFCTDNNPFVAFAARCTSAFPFAFEPMALCDIFDIIRHREKHWRNPYCSPETTQWEKFYLDYIRDVEPGATPFRFRSFGDGGYLDNKPFSYAIDAIMSRHSDVPVDRKLIYVEPSPEDIGLALKTRSGAADRPDVLENTLAALVELPRYETIRQDLERLLTWNRNVIRIRRMIGLAEDQLRKFPTADYRRHPSYEFYLRARRSIVMDEIATSVTLAMRLDPKSSRGEAIRVLAGTWRHHLKKSTERPVSLESPGQARDLTPVWNTFRDGRLLLDTYDVEYLRRAVRFFRIRLHATRKAPDDPEYRQKMTVLSNAQKELRKLQELKLDAKLELDLERKAQLDFVVDPGLLGAVRHEHRKYREEMLVATPAAYWMRVEYLLENGWTALIDQAATLVYDHYVASEGSSRKARLAGIRESLLEVFDDLPDFEIRDSLVYPITFGTDLGEVDPIDVIRISPADTTPIEGVDKKRPNEPALKGEKLGAFGGFLDIRWRLHDMLRGRLDAAERLITAMLPDVDRKTTALREKLIVSAQEEICAGWEATAGSIIEREEKVYASAKPI